MSDRQIGIAMAVTTALCWSLLAIALKVALDYASAGTIVWFRMFVASTLLALFFALKKKSKFKILSALPVVGVIAGASLAANYFGYLKGVELTGASNTQIMIQLGPLGLIPVGIFFFHEIPSRRQVGGIFLAICGFALFFWDQASLSIGTTSQLIFGNLWIIMAAGTWILFASLQKTLSRKWTPQQINLLIYLVAAICLAPLLTPEEMGEWTPGIWILMIILGVNTLIAYGCLGEALKRIPASHTSLIITCNPLLTLIFIQILCAFEVPWLKPESISLKGIIGAAFVISGVILTVWRRTQIQKPQTETQS